jgi:hypothetical protein
MERLRRFVLVATVVTGVLMWTAMPMHWRNDRWFPLVGLAAAIASAATSWAPRFATARFVRILLAGFVSFGILGFAALASRDLGVMGVAVTGALWAFIVAWLVATGVVAQLAVAECRPLDVYLGLVLLFAIAVPFLDSGPNHPAIAAILGIAVLGIGALVCAAITRAIHGRVRRAPKPDLPDARAL